VSGALAKAQRRKIRRALGPLAEDALLDMQERSTDIDKFLLLQHSFWGRVRWLFTGRF
jgi:hypothetical protein